MAETGPDPLVTLADPRSPAAEAYRTLRTNLEFSSLDQPLRTLVVTSAAPEEGKSTTLANLAVAEALAGKRVILVDADLRRPSQHQWFGLKNAAGLTTALLDEGARREPPLQDTRVQGLRVLTAGPLPPNPSELLASPAMAEVIARLGQMADLVLFDAPPVVAVTDAAVLSAQVDGVLLVVQAGRTKREHIERAQTLLEKVRARVIGAVLNDVKTDTTVYRYYGAET